MTASTGCTAFCCKDSLLERGRPLSVNRFVIFYCSDEWNHLAPVAGFLAAPRLLSRRTRAIRDGPLPYAHFPLLSYRFLLAECGTFPRSSPFIVRLVPRYFMQSTRSTPYPNLTLLTHSVHRYNKQDINLGLAKKE